MYCVADKQKLLELAEQAGFILEDVPYLPPPPEMSTAQLESFANILLTLDK